MGINAPIFDVVGLGASTVDLLSRVDHFPTGDETLQASEVTLAGGGPVATALVTLARLGACPAMLDALGDDWRGRLILEEFEREGVDTRSIAIRPGQTSPTSLIVVHARRAQRAILWAPGSAAPLAAAEVPAQVIRSARFLHLNGRHPEACRRAIELARPAGVRVSFDGGANRYRPELDDLLAACDVCIVARQFAFTCTGEQAIEPAAAALGRRGPSLVVITAGSAGSWVFEGATSAFHQQAFVLPQVIDTTGCGDSYHGAFLFGLLQGWSLPNTARFASAVAAFNSQALGGRAGLPSLPQVQAFLAEH